MRPCCQLDIFPSSLCLSTALSLPRDHHISDVDDKKKTRMSLKTRMNDLPLVVLQLICFLMHLPLWDERLRENEALDGPATCKRQSCEADEKVCSSFCKSAPKK